MDKLVGPFSADIYSKGCFPIYVHQIYFIAMAFAASQSVAVAVALVVKRVHDLSVLGRTCNP